MTHLLLIFILLFSPSVQVESAVTWIYSQQQADGGWLDSFDLRRSSPGITADAIIALWAADENFNADAPLLVLEDYAALNRSTLSVGLAAKFVFAAVLTGRDPADFEGVNLIELLQKDTATTYETCLALVAFYVADLEPPEAMLTHLTESTNEDGGWGFTPESSSDTNTTAVCIQAAAAYGLETTPALTYLKTIQNEDGGWPFEKPSDFSTESDAFSTALVMMALHAADENLAAWQNPQNTLLQFQQQDGAFNLTFAGTDDQQMLATVQVIPALSGMSLLDLKP
ncbi:MAG: terpene cyclase/mutase family protein [Anaerolineae bacterium]|nr:terpene cyclase/mutase family protein [Anaerolineae bacterium]